MHYKHRTDAEDDNRYSKEELTKPDQIQYAKGWDKEKWLDVLSIWKKHHLKTTASQKELDFLKNLPDTDKQPAWV